MVKLYRVFQLVSGGAILLGAGGCTLQEFNEFLQTVLLGVTAAGAVAIIRNI
jgi:hypothetical protein